MTTLKAALMVTLAFASGCRQHNVSINGQNLRTTAGFKAPKLPAGVAIEIDGALAALRSYYQTRSVIRLKIASDKIALGDQLELLNDSTGTSLMKAAVAPLADQDPAAPFHLTDPADFSLADQAFDLTLNLYPLDPSYKGKFAYGENHLRLLVGGTAQKFAGSDIHLQDFHFFSMGASSFVDQTQSQGGFQGRVSFISNPIITNNSDEIATGLIGITNH